MARKNRPTLVQQFFDFINRNAPFDGNPLIQKTEHNQVENDLFDSVLTVVDSDQLINNPSSLFAVDFSAFDLYRIDSGASVDNVFTITVNGLGTGQLGRIDVTKKSNDTFNFSNASFNGINNLNQIGLTSIQFYVLNVNDNLFVVSSLSIAKSDSTTANNSNQLATSKAVRDLREASLLRQDFDVEGESVVYKTIAMGDWNMDTTATLSIPHGFGNKANIRAIISIAIRDDSGNWAFPGMMANTLNGFDASRSGVGINSLAAQPIDNTNINLARETGGFYDGIAFNQTSYNRGYITISYVQ